MDISFDPAKRDKTLSERGLDFADADKVFKDTFATAEDTRKNYGEHRFISVGRLDGRMVVIVWTPRMSIDGTDCRHIISMRKANDREQKKYAGQI